MKFLKAITYCLLFLTSLPMIGQNKIRWMTWEEAVKKSETAPKKIFVDVTTQWCGWCKKMDASTFGQDQIAKYVNENYYAVKFDAEYKNPITYKGTTYSYVKTFKGGYHELAATLLSGNLSYPTVVFLDEEGNLIQAIPGFQNASDFEMIINYFGGDYHKTTPWRKFTKNYSPNGNMNIPANNKN